MNKDIQKTIDNFYKKIEKEEKKKKKGTYNDKRH